MSEAWTGEAPNSTRQQQCTGLSSDIVSTMAVSHEANEIVTVLNNSPQFKIPGYVLH